MRTPVVSVWLAGCRLKWSRVTDRRASVCTDYTTIRCPMKSKRTHKEQTHAWVAACSDQRDRDGDQVDLALPDR